jgi:hypothetical protein
MQQPRSSIGRVRIERALDLLERFRWWISGVLVAGLIIWADPADPRSPMTWILIGLFLLLLWIPGVIRLVQGYRRTAAGFRDGLNGH